MSPRMKRRKKPVSPNLLRLFLALWIVASLGYWIAGIVDLWDTRVHWDQRVDMSPSALTPIRAASTKLAFSPKQAPPVSSAGDRIEGLNGAAYSGLAQWATVLSESHPGDILDVDVTHPNGSHATLTSPSPAPPYPYGRMSPDRGLLAGLSPRRPAHPRLPPHRLLGRSHSPNRSQRLAPSHPSHVSQRRLHQPRPRQRRSPLPPRILVSKTLQLAGAPALLLFGIYFPERSRIDARARWIKWALLALFGVSACLPTSPPSLHAKLRRRRWPVPHPRQRHRRQRHQRLQPPLRRSLPRSHPR